MRPGGPYPSDEERAAVREALLHCAGYLERNPRVDPVRFLRECADELEDE